MDIDFLTAWGIPAWLPPLFVGLLLGYVLGKRGRARGVAASGAADPRLRRAQRMQTTAGASDDPGPPTGVPGLCASDREEIERLLAAGNKIAAIKRVREEMGLGLAEAKAFVEAMERR